MELPINRKNKPMIIQPACLMYKGVTFSGVPAYVALNMVDRPINIIKTIIMNAFQSKRVIVLLFSIFYVFLNNHLCHRSCSRSAMTAMLYEYSYRYLRFVHRCKCRKPCVIIESAWVRLKPSSYHLSSSCLSGDLDKTAPCCPACPSRVVYDTLKGFLNEFQCVFTDACLSYFNRRELVDTIGGCAAPGIGDRIKFCPRMIFRHYPLQYSRPHYDTCIGHRIYHDCLLQRCN